MSLDVTGEQIVMSPGPFDPHMHPRSLDPITQDRFLEQNGWTEGKAGLSAYTETAIRSGITGGLIMPNEFIRLMVPMGIDQTEPTVLFDYPISNLDKVRAIQAAIIKDSVIPLGINFGLDPEELFFDVSTKQHIDHETLDFRFASVTDDVSSLKVYLAETTVKTTLNKRFMPDVAAAWSRYNPEKPIIMHVEGADVAEVLHDISKLRNGKEIPLHIAHVSSRQELEAVIEAKKAGMNVTCEVTPHHLFLDEDDAVLLGGYGCMKPGLKTKEDIDFIWANIEHVDMFASDCAPHRRSDKEAESPAFGVTNHTVMVPLLVRAVLDGKLSYEQLYDKLCVKPRQRFNIPVDDHSYLLYNLEEGDQSPADYDVHAAVRYGYSPFSRLNARFNLVGRVETVNSGNSYLDQAFHGHARAFEDFNTSHAHLVRPANIDALRGDRTIWRRP